MARGRRKKTGADATGAGPIALDPVDLLAGLGSGLELQVDDVPAGIDPDAPDTSVPASTTVSDTGRLIRSGDGTIRRLIRTRVLRPSGTSSGRVDAGTDRAGVLPRTPDKPGE